MIATLLLATGILFFWMVFKAFSSREIKARGWGFSCRIYRRDSEPFMYWVNFSCYLVIAVWTTVFAVRAALSH
ncbi:MAG: hypothetical protein NTV58_03545 [Deltaproteobacteria bacterium]|nr:hypothetical protein [Deltaproteobacteria bacterium]